MIKSIIYTYQNIITIQPVESVGFWGIEMAI